MSTFHWVYKALGYSFFFFSQIAEDVDLEYLAEVTEGLSGSDLKEVCEQRCTQYDDDDFISVFNLLVEITSALYCANQGDTIDPFDNDLFRGKALKSEFCS